MEDRCLIWSGIGTMVVLAYGIQGVLRFVKQYPEYVCNGAWDEADI